MSDANFEPATHALHMGDFVKIFNSLFIFLFLFNFYLFNVGNKNIQFKYTVNIAFP